MSILTTIVVSPRERFSSLVPSLKSLFATVPVDTPVIVVEGATPPDIRAELDALNARRPYDHVALPYPVTPNAARNIGAQKAQTKYVVLSDNDIEYQPGWLDALEHLAETQQADAVAPLIFIGPEDPPKIHHAGGWLRPKLSDKGLTMTEQHRLMNADYRQVIDLIPEKAPVENEVCEFHCMMVRRAFLESCGWLDERLITREQMDFALQAKAMNAKVCFAADAHVTYRAFDPVTRVEDLDYFLFRWSDEKVVQSLDAFEETWGVATERDRVRFGWTKSHRGKAVASFRRGVAKLVGRKRTTKWFQERDEHRAALRFADALTDAPTPTAPRRRTQISAAALFDLERKTDTAAQ